MKKLSLKNLNLGASDMLQRNQLKTVFGGDGGYGSGTCGWKSPNNNVYCNISYEQAYGSYLAYGGNWCCDTCGSSSYCN